MDFLKRLAEPSSWIAIAMAAAVVLPGIESWIGWNYLAEVSVSVAALVAVLMREKGG